MAAESTTEIEEIKEISFEDVKSRSEAGSLVLIDVRNPEELEQFGKLPHSINIPLPEVPDVFKLTDEEFKTRVGCAKPEKNSEIAFTCRSGKRAEAALLNLRDMGYSELILYKGSFIEWESKGGPIIK